MYSGNPPPPQYHPLPPPSPTSSIRPASRSSNREHVRAAFAQGPASQWRDSGSSTHTRNPYDVHGRSSSISQKFSLPPDPSSWGGRLRYTDDPEPDDHLHNPDPKRDRKSDRGGTICTCRGIANLGCLLILAAGILMLFAGYPIMQHFMKRPQSTQGAFNVGGTNGTGQVPSIPGNWGLIDIETPDYAKTRVSFTNPADTLQLVFSDEFNTDGRTFYPGDDPYWEAVDLHYWQTGNMEWYDPAAVTTKDGSLQITLSKKETHGMDYQGGMVSTWNKFCFTGGLVEASVVLPGASNVVGLWPAVWTMGNLGRAGFGGSLDGMWPYTYDSCDVGTVKNQTLNGKPLAATEKGDKSHGGVLSYLPGQRLSRCTCPGEVHPGPTHQDGTFVGRSAPEIDVFEAQVSGIIGFVSQSAQFAPFNAEYTWFNTTDNLLIPDSSLTTLNSYKGGVYQQAVSSVTTTNPDCYELGTGCSSVYGIEYKPGFDDAYITWISDNKTAWTLESAGMAADNRTEIGARPIPQEPLYVLVNLGMSTAFGYVDLDHLTFPSTMKVDYIRVYQKPDAINVGCDPEDFPTQAYINQFIDAYTNPNYTTWTDDFGQPVPKSSFLGQC